MANANNLMRLWRGAVEPFGINEITDEFATNLLRSSEDTQGVGWSQVFQNLGSPPVLVAAAAATATDEWGNEISLDRWTFECGGIGGGDRSRLQNTISQIEGATYTCGIWLATVSGTVDVILLVAARQATDTITITTTPQRFELTGTSNITVSTEMVDVQAQGNISGAAAFDLLVGGSQSNAGSTLDRYVKTTSVGENKRFRTDTGAPPVKTTVTNLQKQSRDLSGPPWVLGTTATVTGQDTLNLPAVGDLIYNPTVAGLHDVGSAILYTYSVLLCGSGTVTIRIRDGFFSAGEVNRQITLTPTPTRYSVTINKAVSQDTASRIVSTIRRATGDTATKVWVSEAQIEVGDSFTNFVLTGATSKTRVFGGNVISMWKGAVEPQVGRLIGLPSFELPIPTGLENQVIPIRTVGSSILKIDLFNSSFVVVDRRTVIKTELWNSNTIIKVAD